MLDLGSTWGLEPEEENIKKPILRGVRGANIPREFPGEPTILLDKKPRDEETRKQRRKKTSE